MEKTLYVYRPLLNGNQVRDWMADHGGFDSSLPAPDMHVTIAYSKTPFDWSGLSPDIETLSVEGGKRDIQVFDDNAVVLSFSSVALAARWQEFLNAGASWSFPSYRPHVTLTYADATGLEDDPYMGPLEFGGEKFAEITGFDPDDVDEADIVAKWDEGDCFHVDYTVMTPGRMIEAMGTDAMRWAIAFCQMKDKMGWQTGNIDVDLMIGWFASAIQSMRDSKTSVIRLDLDPPFTVLSRSKAWKMEATGQMFYGSDLMGRSLGARP